MNKKKLLILPIMAFLFITLISSSLIEAKSSDKSKNKTKQPIELNHTTKVMYVDKTFKLELLNAKKEVTWSSSDESVATVNNGRVKGIGAGFAYIYAESNGKQYSCHVKVKVPELNITSKRLRINTSFQLEIKGTKVLSYKSSNKKAVRVDKEGNVTGRKKGKSTITVNCDNGLSYTCEVEVYKNVLDVKEPKFSDLAPTTKMSFEELVGDNGNYDDLVAMPNPKTYKIIVDLYYKVVMAYTKDENGEYTIPVRYMLCSPGKSSTPTPTGTFKMENYRLRYHIFNGTNCYAQYWCELKGRIYFHSILYTSLKAKDYTDTSYDNLGTGVSHGCIRLTVPDARWMYYNVAPGSKVVVRKGSSDDKETATIKKQLVLPKRPKKRPALKMGEIPDTDNWTIEEVLQEFEFVQGSQNGGEAAG